MWRADSPPSFGHSLIGPNTFVASTTLSRRPPPFANHRPEARPRRPGPFAAAGAMGGGKEVAAVRGGRVHHDPRVALGGGRPEFHRPEAEPAPPRGRPPQPPISHGSRSSPVCAG